MDKLVAGGDVNPLKSDFELQTLLKGLEKIKKYKSFQRWKTKFLDRLQQFLYEDGMQPAERACNDFSTLLKKFVKSATKVQEFIDKGELGDNKKTVKASLALSEMCKSLTTVVSEVQNLIPSKAQEEKKRGFTKFHLGTVLIRQGFHQYTTMQAIKDALEQIGTALANVADKQQHDLFESYTTQVQRFCDVMADLNLYEVMMKCLEFAEAPEIEESSSEEPITMEITIVTPDGKVLRLELEPGETIGNIKEAIAGDSGIIPIKQVLKFNGMDLDDPSQTLEGLGIPDGAQLNVDVFKVPITVNTMDGDKVNLMVDPTSYLSDIKRMLENETGLPARNQRLLMDGTELADDLRTVADCGVKAGSVLDLEPKTIKITVTTPDNRRYAFEMKPTDSCNLVKAKIADSTGLAVPRQVLKFGDNVLGDENTLKDVGVRDGAELNVEIFKVPITVNTMDGRKINVMVDPCSYISDIKRQLESETGLPAKNQRLIMNGNELGDDLKTAGDYGIKAGSELDVEPKTIKVTVEMPDGRKHSIDVKPSDTTDVIKEKVFQVSGMTIPRQVLKFQGNELPNDGSTVKAMGIQDGSPLTVEIFKVPITVNAPDGRKIKVMVDPTCYVSDIKRQIEEEAGLPAGNQRLVLDGNELDDLKTAGDSGIQAGSELDLEPKTIKITVEMPDGKVHTLPVKLSDTADSIKGKISQVTGMAVPRQVLKFQGNELPSDGSTVKAMGIQDGSPLTVEIFKVPIIVNAPDGRKIKVMVDPTCNVSDIKRQIEEEAGLPAGNQRLVLDGNELDDLKTAGDSGIQAGSELDLEPKTIKITVEMPDGKVHTLPVKLSDTADSIKGKISQVTGMAVPRQVLKFQGNELPSDGSTVKAMGIQDGSPLTVEIFKVPIIVNAPDGRKIKVMVDPTCNVSDIKRQIEDEAGLPAGNQRLVLDGNELDDLKTAAESGIQAGSELDLEPKTIKVTVEMPDGKTHTLDLKPPDTSQSIKTKIAQLTGMAAPRQVLKLQGKELPSDGSTIREMGIQEGSVVTVEVFKVPITVNTMDGRKIKIMVDPSCNVVDIKRQIEDEAGLPVGNQRLVLDGNELDDLKTAAESGIQAGSELDLEPKTIKVTVEMPDGKTHTLDLKPPDTSQSIKTKIAQLTGMAAPRQVLKLQGKELPSDGSTIRDMGIQEGSVLMVEVLKVPITVNTMDGRKIKVMVDPSCNVVDIKRQIEDEAGLPSGNQRLVLDGNELDDLKTAAESGIQAGSELDLEPKSIKISVEMPDGKIHSLDLKPSDTSDSIKTKIAQVTGMAVPRQVLKFQGKDLPSDGKTVKDLGIQEGSKLNVEVFKIPVTVKTPDGRKIKVMVDPTSSIVDIKRQLEGDSGLPVGNQRLALDGNELDDLKTAAECGIKAGSEIDLEPKAIKITVEMPDGKTHSVDAKPFDTADSLKGKIAEMTGMTVPRQVLKYQGKELPGKGAMLKDIGIQDGSKVNVEVFKIPVSVSTIDDQIIKVMVDPTSSLSNVKRELEAITGLPATNQNISKDDADLTDERKTMADYGVEAGSRLDLEPKMMKVSVEMPGGKACTVDIKPSDTVELIREKVADASGLAAPRQILKMKGKELPSGVSARAMGIREGSSLVADLFKIPITVKTGDGRSFPLHVEPCDTIDAIKSMIEKECGMDSKKQCLRFANEELNNGRHTANQCGIEAGSTLTVELRADPIIFVDVKCGTLFGVERERVIEQNILTLNQGNKLDYLESSNDSAAKDKILNAMMGSPKLGVANQVVVTKAEVEDYELEEAEKVKSVWGVNLKKREKNKKGEEFIFVDPKTGACGELSRTKYIEMGFITPVTTNKGDTLKEEEKDHMKYDKYVADIRQVFGVKFT